MNCKIVGVLAVLIATATTPACAQTPSPEKLQAAYDIAVKCFIADGYAAGNRKRAGDSRRQRYYDDKANLASTGGLKLGKALGYPDRKFVDDALKMKDTEIPKYTADPDYFPQIAATCKAYGFM